MKLERAARVTSAGRSSRWGVPCRRRRPGRGPRPSSSSRCLPPEEHPAQGEEAGGGSWSRSAVSLLPSKQKRPHRLTRSFVCYCGERLSLRRRPMALAFGPRSAEHERRCSGSRLVQMKSAAEPVFLNASGRKRLKKRETPSPTKLGEGAALPLRLRPGHVALTGRTASRVRSPGHPTARRPPVERGRGGQARAADRPWLGRGVQRRGPPPPPLPASGPPTSAGLCPRRAAALGPGRSGPSARSPANEQGGRGRAGRAIRAGAAGEAAVPQRGRRAGGAFPLSGKDRVVPPCAVSDGAAAAAPRPAVGARRSPSFSGRSGGSWGSPAAAAGVAGRSEVPADKKRAVPGVRDEGCFVPEPRGVGLPRRDSGSRGCGAPPALSPPRRVPSGMAPPHPFCGVGKGEWPALAVTAGKGKAPPSAPLSQGREIVFLFPTASSLCPFHIPWLVPRSCDRKMSRSCSRAVLAASLTFAPPGPDAPAHRCLGWCAGRWMRLAPSLLFQD